MFRSLLVARRRKKAEAAFARKWMVPKPKGKPDPMFGRKWIRRWDAPHKRGLFGRVRTSWALRVAAGGTGALMATGGMAYAGVLPDPVQQMVSDVADKIGVDVPSPEDERGSETSKAVHGVKERKDEFENGRDFGHATRDAAHAANERRRAAKADDRKLKEKDPEEGTDLGGDGSHPAVSKPHPVKDEDGKNSDKGKPEDPGKSTAPEPPVQQEKPEKPVTPEKPAQPETPKKPMPPQTPTKPVPPPPPDKPEPPAQPEKPEKPEDPKG